MNYYLSVLKKYAVFSGRAQRAEYWYFFLFNTIISFILTIISPVDVVNDLGIHVVFALAIFLPGLGVSVRRLHDVGKSGWMLLIALIPFIGTIWYIVLMVRDGNPGGNKYGLNPKETQTA
jgi:uncharacterized membrane protein YhaH (DUF805 family)